MILLTVGTQFPFDRLVKAVDEIAGNGGLADDVVAQIGDSDYKPRNFNAVKSLDKADFDRYIKEASAVIGHAGMGTIAAALEYEKPLLVMPRLKEYGEVVNDHQIAIATRFGELGHVLVTLNVAGLPEAVRRLKTFVPRKREAAHEKLVQRIRQFLETLAAGQSG